MPLWVFDEKVGQTLAVNPYGWQGPYVRGPP